MKKILSIFLVICMVLCFTSCNTDTENKKFTIVASCYPVYAMLLNLTTGIGEIEVVNMTASVGGCIHDYTLTTDDMRLLSDCDLFIVSGAGLEPFLEEVKNALPKLNIKDASVNVTLLGENEHYWLDAENVITASKTLVDVLQSILPGYISQISSNFNYFSDTLQKLAKKPKLNGLKAISFHEGFEYILDGTGAEIVAMIDSDSGTQLSAKDIIELEKKCIESGANAIFVESENNTADIIATDLGIRIYTLDPLTSGDDTSFYFTESMEANNTILSNIHINSEEGITEECTTEEASSNALH